MKNVYTNTDRFGTFVLAKTGRAIQCPIRHENGAIQFDNPKLATPAIKKEVNTVFNHLRNVGTPAANDYKA